MSIYTQHNTPYTYLIGWSKFNTYYYGLRFAAGCHPNELWKTYFTSSKYVADFRNQNGEPDIIEIRKIFQIVTVAQLWEHRVLKRMKVVQRKDFLNRTDNKSIAPQYGSDNPASRQEVKNKIQKSVNKWYETHDGSNLGRKLSEETKLKLSKAKTGELNPFYNKKHSEETKLKLSKAKTGELNPFYNKNHSEETKLKISAARSGIPKPRVCCIYCDKQVAINLFTRWHGDNCKNR